MIRVVFPEEMKRWDAACIAAGTSALTLMHRAAKGLFDAVLRLRKQPDTVTVFCGSGNNGGDGYALAVLLQQHSIPVRIIELGIIHHLTPESAYYRKEAIHFDIPMRNDWDPLQDELLVDAIFGIGLSRPITGHYAEVIRRMNDSGKRILSADIPSGLDASLGSVLGIAVCATETVTMQFPKIGMLLGKGRAYTGSVTICTLDAQFTVDFSSNIWHQEAKDIAAVLPSRPFDSHKGKNGHALLCVGSKQYIGAALLSAKACLRSGCGILSVVTPDAVRPAFSTLPEAITVPTGTEDWNDVAYAIAAQAFTQKSAIGIGCGLGSGDCSALLQAALQTGLPLVIDADGLNTLSRHPELYTLLHQNAVLTPHPGEMARLLQKTVAEVLADPLGCANAFPCTVLLKGATTIVSDGNHTVLCTEGTPGLSKGGSGDVLCGIITALLAQGLCPFDAARAGTYLLGTSAKDAYRLLGQRMLLASDVIDALGEEYESND